MANGMTRNALARIQIDGKKATDEMNEEMARLGKKLPAKIALKNPSSHNHSK